VLNLSRSSTPLTLPNLLLPFIVFCLFVWFFCGAGMLSTLDRIGFYVSCHILRHISWWVSREAFVGCSGWAERSLVWWVPFGPCNEIFRKFPSFEASCCADHVFRIVILVSCFNQALQLGFIGYRTQIDEQAALLNSTVLPCSKLAWLCCFDCTLWRIWDHLSLLIDEGSVLLSRVLYLEGYGWSRTTELGSDIIENRCTCALIASS
jgi:hypothetical protein